MNNDSAHFWDHVEELRKTCLAILIIILCTFCLCWSFRASLLSWLSSPLKTSQPPPISREIFVHRRYSNTTPEEAQTAIPLGARLYESTGQAYIEQRTLFLSPGADALVLEPAEEGHSLAIFGPIDGFTACLRLCLWSAVVLSAPLWILLLVQFVRPALRVHESNYIAPFFLSLVGAGSCAIYLATYYVIPKTAALLYAFNASLGQNIWSLERYVSFSLFMGMGCCLMLELAAAALLLAHYGILGYQALSRSRRVVWLAAFVFGAFFTPPDVISQLFVAIPTIGLYEVVVLYAWVRRRLPATRYAE